MVHHSERRLAPWRFCSPHNFWPDENFARPLPGPFAFRGGVCGRAFSFVCVRARVCARARAARHAGLFVPQELLLASQKSLLECSSTLPEVERVLLLENPGKLPDGPFKSVCRATSPAAPPPARAFSPPGLSHVILLVQRVPWTSDSPTQGPPSTEEVQATPVKCPT